MCGICFKQDNSVLFNKSELESKYRSNPDGSGLLYYDKQQDRMVVEKGIMGTPFETIYNSVQRVESNVNARNIAIHFRIGTSGGKTINQCHPMKISGDKGLMHNGVCSHFDFEPEYISDTQLMALWFKGFFEKENLGLNDLKSKFARRYLNKNYGLENNRVLIIEKENWIILNEDTGEWVSKLGKSAKEYTPSYGIWGGYQTRIIDPKEVTNFTSEKGNSYEIPDREIDGIIFKKKGDIEGMAFQGDKIIKLQDDITKEMYYALERDVAEYQTMDI